MNIYCGNLAYDTTDDVLRSTFEEHGKVSTAKVIMDRDAGRSKGFGFVEMDDEQEAQAAIQTLNGALMDGRNIRVNEAKPRTDDNGRRGPKG